MGTSFLVFLTKPLLLFALLLVSIPFTLAAKRWLPDSKIKRLLLDREFLEGKPLLQWGIWLFSVVFMFAMGGLGLYIHGL